jgi:hypothetical protein
MANTNFRRNEMPKLVVFVQDGFHYCAECADLVPDASREDDAVLYMTISEIPNGLYCSSCDATIYDVEENL